MSETKKLADEASRMSQDNLEQARKMGQQYTAAAQDAAEVASRSFGVANEGFQALAAEMMNYSKAAFDDAIRSWTQLIGVKTLVQAVEIQTQYAKRAYANHVAELSKLSSMTVGMIQDSSKPVEKASKRFTG